MAKRGLYANIHAKRRRIKAGSKEKMESLAKGPTANFRRAAKTARKDNVKFSFAYNEKSNH